MPRVIAEGTARNLTVVPGKTHEQDASEKRYVTFVNEVGAVHTFIVDLEHVAQDVAGIFEFHAQAANHVEFGAPKPDDRREQPADTGADQGQVSY